MEADGTDEANRLYRDDDSQHRLIERLRQEEKEYADRLVHHVLRRAPEESPAVLREEPPKAD